MTLKDPVKIKNWFAYRNRKMKNIIKQGEIASLFVNVKPAPSYTSYFYMNIANEIYAHNAMILFKSLFSNAFIQQAHSNLHFTVKREI